MTDESDFRKGWCPGALRPMEAKDGLLVRLKISGGIVSTSTMRAIAQAGRDYGNAHFDLSSRANLQMRGVRQEKLPYLIEMLDGLGLIDQTMAAEAVRNVLVSPFAGLDGRDDASCAGKAIEAMLAANEDLHALPARFGFLIDDGSPFSLAALPADVRFDWVGGSKPFAIGVGGRANEAYLLGRCQASEIADIAAQLARAFLKLASQLSKPPGRMRGLIEKCGPAVLAGLCGMLVFSPRSPRSVAEPCPVGLLRLDGSYCFGAAAAFGHLDADMLDAIASAAETFGNGEIRLTPWRALILPLTGAETIDAIRFYLEAHHFITNRKDPRLAVEACRGVLTCERGSTDPRDDALALMSVVRRLFKTGTALHVSGCAKGCARHAAVPLTLTARAGLYDLTADETASAAGVCSERGLTLAAVRQRLEAAAQVTEQYSDLEVQ